MERDCSTSSIVTTNVTIGYGVAYCTLFIVVSVYSFHFLMRYNMKFEQSKFSKKLLMWIKDIWKRKKCYIPIITHLFDQITDVSVGLQFYELSKTKYHNNWDQCGGLNIWYLFIITIGAMLVYRIISAMLIYQSSQKSIKRLILQLLDIELFRALYINYLCDKTEACDPQRWITAMEASLESTPQALVQMIYLVKTNTFTSSPLVVISLLSSIWSIIAKLVSDDKVIVINEAKTADFKPKPIVLIDICIIISVPITILIICAMIIETFVLFIICCPCLLIAYRYKDKWNKVDNTDTGIPNKKDYKLDLPHIESQIALNDLNTNKENSDSSSNDTQKVDHFEWISWLYVLRLIWRILDVSSLIFLRTLCWIIIGGTALTVITGLEAICFLSICFNTKQWDFLFGIVALIAITTGDSFKIQMGIFVYRSASNLIIIILITIWLTVNFDCPRCTDYVIRHAFLNDAAIFTVFIYTWICVVIIPCITLFLTAIAFNENASLSRNIDKMILAKNYSGILELQLYTGQLDVYDIQKKKTLLMLALKEKRVAIVSYLLKNTAADEWNQLDTENKNILDYYLEEAVNIEDADKYRSMTDSLVKIYKEYPNLSDSGNGRNAFLCGFVNKEVNIVEAFENFDENVIFLSKDEAGHNILDYYVDDILEVSTKTMFKLYENQTDVCDSNGRNAFFCAAYKGDLQIFNEFISKYEGIEKSTDNTRENILDYYVDKRIQLPPEILFKIYEDETNMVDKSGRNAFLCAVARLDVVTTNAFITKYEDIMKSMDLGMTSQDLYLLYLKTGDTEGIEIFVSKNPEIIKVRDESKCNILDYYLLNANLISNKCLIDIYKQDNQIKTLKQQMTVFLCACYHGNIECVKQLIEINNEVLKETNIDSYNAASIAKLNNQQDIVNYLKNNHDIDGEKPVNELVKGIVKILLLGAGDVGKSTIFKQLREFYTGYTDSDRLQFKDHIFAQIVEDMRLSLECIDILKEDESDEYKDVELSENGKAAADQLQSAPTLQVTQQIADAIEILWKEDAIRLIYDLRNTMKIDDSSAYFWDEVRRISQNDYIPTYEDILLVKYRTTGVIEMKLEVRNNVYHIFDTGGQKSERKKWIHCFELVTAVIYVASLNSFDEVMFEDEEKNSMVDQVELFEQICNNEWFKETAMILFLNKIDLFTKKISTVSITECPVFEDYNGDTKSFEETTEFIKDTFESCNQTADKPIFTHLTCAIDTIQVMKVLGVIQKPIINASILKNGQLQMA